MNGGIAVSRGMRNNNPLNIRIVNGTKWQGQCLKQTDRDFVQFDTMALGIRAALKILAHYIDSYHLHTVRLIVGRWAPKVENDTGHYISAVLSMSGLGGNEIIHSDDEKQMKRLVAAMARVENGVAVDSKAIDEGWRLYRNEDPKYGGTALRAASYIL
jgi:hypothetical protein